MKFWVTRQVPYGCLAIVLKLLFVTWYPTEVGVEWEFGRGPDCPPPCLLVRGISRKQASAWFHALSRVQGILGAVGLGALRVAKQLAVLNGPSLHAGSGHESPLNVAWATGAACCMRCHVGCGIQGFLTVEFASIVCVSSVCPSTTWPCNRRFYVSKHHGLLQLWILPVLGHRGARSLPWAVIVPAFALK